MRREHIPGADGTCQAAGISATRQLYEVTVRREVAAANTNLTLLAGGRAAGLSFSGDGSAVAGAPRTMPSQKPALLTSGSSICCAAERKVLAGVLHVQLEPGWSQPVNRFLVRMISPRRNCNLLSCTPV